jgi:hypothetical protein
MCLKVSICNLSVIIFTFAQCRPTSNLSICMMRYMLETGSLSQDMRSFDRKLLCDLTWGGVRTSIAYSELRARIQHPASSIQHANANSNAHPGSCIPHVLHIDS